MRQKTGPRKSPGEKIVKDINGRTCKHYSSKEKIRIVFDGLRVEGSIAEREKSCQPEQVRPSM
jgi:transposase